MKPKISGFTNQIRKLFFLKGNWTPLPFTFHEGLQTSIKLVLQLIPSLDNYLACMQI